MAIEEPVHETLQTFPEWGIRRYPPYLVAETRVKGALEEASNEGFRRLAGYIFGGNQKQEKIAMTAPVGTQALSEHEWRITFSMPRSWTLETLPLPNDPKVKIISEPERWLAVLTFSGRWTEERFREKAAFLQQALESQQFQSRGQPAHFAGYNPPFIPWFLRRNEVWIEIEKPRLEMTR